MRIGILTFHRAINYGAFMQSYALLNRISQEFPEDNVEIIDYNCKAREFFIKKCPIVFLYRRSFREGIQKYKQTKVFRKSLQFLKRSKELVAVSDKVLEDYIADHYDVVIVGSDAVFNWSDIGLPNPYFLNKFKNIWKLSYAASSHLQNYGNITKNEKEYLFDSLNDFSYIGVRDNSTERFVNSILENSKARHNCDPSVFLELDFDEFDLRKKMKKCKFDFKKKTVFVMLMHPEYGEYIRKYFGNDCQIVALMDGNQWADIYLYDLNPFEWSHVFKYGECLITDYFHGTIFGLKNKVPVMSIDASKYNDHNYESKAHDLFFTRLNLPQYYVDARDIEGKDGYSVFSEKLDLILKNYDYSEIGLALEKEAEAYNDFHDMLSRVCSKKREN